MDDTKCTEITSADKEFWESKYAAKETPWNKGEASPGLVHFLRHHPPAKGIKVLVPGCGFGHDTVPWMNADCLVTGLDLAPSAVESASELHKHPNLKFAAGDFINQPPLAEFDIMFEHTLFCAIPPALREGYVRSAWNCLKPEGQLVAIHYMIPDKEGPPFGTNREEVLRFFSPHFQLVDEWTPPSYEHRTGLERLFWWKRKS